MILVTLKSGEQWGWIVRLFGREGLLFESSMKRFVLLVSYIFKAMVTAA